MNRLNRNDFNHTCVHVIEEIPPISVVAICVLRSRVAVTLLEFKTNCEFSISGLEKKRNAVVRVKIISPQISLIKFAVEVERLARDINRGALVEERDVIFQLHRTKREVRTERNVRVLVN